MKKILDVFKLFFAEYPDEGEVLKKIEGNDTYFYM